ncbi:hypothetical protein LCGC14_1239770 [marine sediment metagenome]|uniref:HNH nuclease domain-containing protein n=1 Tax=marine sediment metagenome TaxID=412755 RepID=A0A0F9PAD0_9ZZZZ
MKRLSYEFVKEQFEKEGYELLSKEYVNNHTKLGYICSEGHNHATTWNKFKGGVRCPHCSKYSRKYTIDEIKSAFEKEGYTLLSTKYKKAKDKLLCICSNGHAYKVSWYEWNGLGSRCAECAIDNRRKDFGIIEGSFVNGGYTLLTSKFEYRGGKQKLKYICNNGHKHSIRWDSWKAGNRCPSCFHARQSLITSGINHWNWRGGITPLVRAIRNDTKRSRWTQKVFRKDIYICQKCKNKKNNRLHAHHIIQFNSILSHYNITTIKEARACSLLYDINNGMTLCKKCHKWVHSNKNVKNNFIVKEV